METGKGNRKLQYRRPLALAAFACLALAAATTSNAANPVPCDTDASDEFRSLNVSTSDFTVDRSETRSSPDTAIPDALENDRDPEDAATPMLFLTPRIASILESVFNHDSDAPDAADSEDVMELGDTARSERLDPRSKSAPVTVIDRDVIAPQLQRKMYRKDI